MWTKIRGWFSSLFDNPPKAQIGVAVFVLVFLSALAVIPRQCHASEVTLEGGYTLVRGPAPALGLNVRWPNAGPANTDWEVGFRLTGQSEYKGHNPNAVTVYGMLVDGFGPFEIGLGFAHTNVETTYHCKDTFQLMAGFRFWERFTVRYYHDSSAGSCKPNVGRDTGMAGVQMGWNF